MNDQYNGTSINGSGTGGYSNLWGTGYTYGQWCSYRVPCGYCTQRNMMCPVSCGISWNQVTCTNSSVTSSNCACVPTEGNQT